MPNKRRWRFFVYKRFVVKDAIKIFYYPPRYPLTNVILRVYNRNMMKIDKKKDKKIIEMREKLGYTWTLIGKTYGMTRQGAQDYYNRAKKRQDAEPEHWSIKVRRMVVKIKQGLKN